MSLNYPEEHSHPEELLEAYALDALDEDEAEVVAVHLEDCVQCQVAVSSLLEAASELALSVMPEAPPAELRSRVMAELTGLQVELAPARRATTPSPPARLPASPWLLPLAASLVIALFGVSIIMNLNVSSRVDRLSEENSTMTAQLGQTVAETQRLQQQNAILTARLDQTSAHEINMLNSLQQMQVASYLIVHPNTQPLILEPPSGSGAPQGVLLVDETGQRAVLMVSNMEQPTRLRSYQVWLVKDGNRIPVGTVQVDDTGWGTLDLKPPEPMFSFDWVNLTVDDQDGAVPEGQRMVLRSRIP